MTAKKKPAEKPKSKSQPRTDARKVDRAIALIAAVNGQSFGSLDDPLTKATARAVTVLEGYF